MGRGSFVSEYGKLAANGERHDLDSIRPGSPWRQTSCAGYSHRGALLLEWLAAGMTIDEIAKEYPSLTEESIRGTVEELAHSDLLAPSENPS
jgi:hypothetical protein